MALTQTIFKGIEQVTYATFSGMTGEKKLGKLFLVKRDDGEYGDIYFGTRHYGHFSQDEIDKLAKAIEDIAANKKAIEKNASDIKQQRADFDELEALVDGMAEYEYKEITELPAGKTAETLKSVPSEVTKDSSEYILVGTQYYQKVVKSIPEIIKSLKELIAEVDTKFNDYKVKSVASGDKVLSVDEAGVLSSSMSLKYDSKNKIITLYGGAQDEAHKIGEVSTVDFVRDGMIETAELVTVTEKDGEFVYGNDEKKAPESVTEAGKYIRLVFNTSEEVHKEDVFLSVQELVDVYTGGKDVKVNTNNSIDVSLDEEITVMGVSVGTLTNNSTLKAGMSLSEILKQMLIKEIDVKATNPSVKISMTNPTAGDTFEVGSSVEVKLAHTYTDGKFNGADTLYSYDVNAGCTEGTTTYKRGDTTVEKGTETVTVGEGTYTYNCTTDYGANTVTPVKNNGKNSEVTIAAGSCESGNEVSFYGKYYGYMGYSDKTLASEFTSDLIKGLGAKKSFLNKDANTVLVDSAKSNGKSIVVAVPNKYKLAAIQNGVGASILPNFDSEDTIDYVNGSTTTSYKVYVYPITNGAEVEFKNVIISKA